MIAALVLAGGGSTRLGRPKQVEPWGETTLLGHVVAEVEKGPFDLRVVVVGSASEQVLETVDLSQWMVVENPEWEEGIASSLRVGLDAIHRLSRAETVAIFLGDEPTVDQAVISALDRGSDQEQEASSHPQVSLRMGSSGSGRSSALASPDEPRRRLRIEGVVPGSPAVGGRGLVRSQVAPRRGHR